MNRTILCVDDDEGVRKLLTQILNARGHAVSVASNGVDALALVTAKHFDVVLTDHRMPQMTGLELVRHLQAAAYSGKIIVFSGDLSATHRQEYEALRVDAIFTKPMGLKDILALLRKL